MAHFAKIDGNNKVRKVIVIDNQYEEIGSDYIQFTLGLEGEWIQTSYNNNFRGNFAGPGYYYDRINDVFISPKPFESWVLNEETWRWEAPKPIPDITQPGWVWNENQLEWNNILK